LSIVVSIGMIINSKLELFTIDSKGNLIFKRVNIFSKFLKF
jgi:hypothetical protein